MNDYKVPEIVSKNKGSESYTANLLVEAGFRFYWNLDDGGCLIQYQNKPIRRTSKADKPVIEGWARKNDIREATVYDAIGLLIDLNRKSYIQTCLESLEWDGEPRIESLAHYIDTDDRLSSDTLRGLLTSWIVGAAGRGIDKMPHPVLVIEGEEGIGKSHFTSWLGSVIDSGFVSSPINIFNEKDTLYKARKYFIWEVINLKPSKKGYSEHFQTFLDRWWRSSLIATVHPDSNYRKVIYDVGETNFIIIPVAGFSFKYTQFDIKQIWAEAVFRWKAYQKGMFKRYEDVLRR